MTTEAQGSNVSGQMLAYMYDVQTRKVDPELFLWCANVFEAAYNFTMPMEEPGPEDGFQVGGVRYQIASAALNRGLTAVAKELDHHADLSDEQRMSIGFRVLSIWQVMRTPELANYIKRDDLGRTEISDALIRACAHADMTLAGTKILFDIGHLSRLAQEYAHE